MTEVRHNKRVPLPEEDWLPEIANLVLNRRLDDIRLGSEQGWRQNVGPISRPFLEHVAALLGKGEVRFYQPRDVSKTRETFDHVDISVGESGITAFVAVGFVNGTDDEPDLEKALTWGLRSWAWNSDDVMNKSDRIRSMMPDGFLFRKIPGEASGWPNPKGANLVAFKCVPAGELALRRLDELSSEIVADIKELIS